MSENKPVNGETTTATVTSGETQAFLHPKPTTVEIKDTKSRGPACLSSFGCKICAITTAVFGCVFILIGILALAGGKGFLEKKILASMALTPGSDRFESWLRPPVQPHLTGYAWHVTNPDQVLAGAKPILEEKGPYTYKSVTIKDADDNIEWSDDNSELVYRPRKVYTYVPELSGEGLDPWKDYITVPNIPLWTGLNSLRGKSATAKGIGRSLVTENGLGTPFVNVSFNGLLWGYNDELPCLKLDMPEGCASEDESSPFGGGGGDDWGDDDWKRKKRSVDDEEYYEEFEEFNNPDKDPNSEWYGKALPKAEFVDCKCEWGLFRDRNVTMRNPLRIFTGVDELSVKGVVKRYNGKKTLGWWKEGSTCDKVKGQDSSTLPPQLTKEDKLGFATLFKTPINVRQRHSRQTGGKSS